MRNLKKNQSNNKSTAFAKQLARLNSLKQIRCDKDMSEVKSRLRNMGSDIEQFHQLAKAAKAGDVDDVIWQQSL